MVADTASDLIALTTYFNPYRYRSRLSNYKIFEEHILSQQVPLWTLELAFGGSAFELSGPHVIQLRAPDIMWQKERLINLALPLVPERFTKIAWLDCDVLFTSPDWAKKLSLKLDTIPVAQAFSKVRFRRAEWGKDLEEEVREGSIAAHFRSLNFGGSEAGLAWGMRREILQKCGLFDSLISGIGHVAFLMALYYETNGLPWARTALYHPLFATMSEPHLDSYMDWTLAIHQAVQRKVGFLDEEITCLWHGKANSGAGGRFDILRHFDPQSDLTQTESGCWQWSPHASDTVKNGVRSFFIGRHEDG